MDKKFYIDCTNDTQATEEMKTVYKLEKRLRVYNPHENRDNTVVVSTTYYSEEHHAVHFLTTLFQELVNEQAKNVFPLQSLKVTVNENRSLAQLELRDRKNVFTTWTYEITKLMIKEATIEY